MTKISPEIQEQYDKAAFEFRDLMARRNLTEAHERAAVLASLLVSAFEWSKTRQGHAYWAEVHKHLMEGPARARKARETRNLDLE